MLGNQGDPLRCGAWIQGIHVGALAANAALPAGWRQSPGLAECRPDAWAGSSRLDHRVAEDLGIGAAEIVAIEQRHVGELAGGNRGSGESERVGRCGGGTCTSRTAGQACCNSAAAGSSQTAILRRRMKPGEFFGPGQQFAWILLTAGIGNAQKNFVAMGIESGGADFRLCGQHFQPGDGHHRDSGAFGQPLGGAETDANPGEAARPADHDDAADIAEG